MIRDGVVDDVPALVDLENKCFETDRMSARSIKNFITKGRSPLIVDEENGVLRGYALVLLHSNTSLARLYSIAVDPKLRGQGVGKALLQEAEKRALKHNATRMRLEVHQKNKKAQKLYIDMGYRTFAVHEDYYEDHASAVRMEKLLAKHLAKNLNRVPYYAQTLEFTCGPACLIMAMNAFDKGINTDRAFEFKLWREATTIFMTSGHGGCGPLGLALAAHKRGFDVSVSASNETEMFIDSVRSEIKKDVIRLVEEGFQTELAQTGIKVSDIQLSAKDLCNHLDSGAIPVVLISAYRLSGDKIPHWVVATAYDDRFIYINDPFVDVEENRSPTDCIGIPITPQEFERMMRFGSQKHFAAIIINNNKEKD
ncbi:MAG: peptidase C39 family protein [Rhodospirillaceae bacterium]|nr:peptidase C39 family protein [Rhodospirillaceae bacterium]